MKMRSFHRLTLSVAALAVAAVLLQGQASAQEAKAEPVKAEPVKATPTKKSTSGAPKVRPLSVTVDLISKTKIAGTLTDTTQVEMQSSFGTVNIPLSEVAGIKFASADDPSTTVVMLNGDSITGATDVKLITVETEWGTATINGVSIASILFVPGLSWNSQAGLNGARWNLNEAKPTTANASNAAAQGRVGATRPSTNNRGVIQGRSVQSFPGNFQSFQSR